jgi:hypothetical protein
MKKSALRGDRFLGAGKAQGFGPRIHFVFTDGLMFRNDDFFQGF